jgi:Fe-Mn family superoxide dismutase
MASSSSLRMLSSNLKKAHTLVSRSRFATRSVHKRRALLYPVEDGVGHFLPPEALKTAVEWQEGLLERLNEEVKGAFVAFPPAQHALSSPYSRH